MARQDVIIRLRMSGEEFDREFKAQLAGLEDAAEKSSVAAGARSGGGFMKGFLGAAGAGALGAAIGNAISSAADLGAEIASTSRQFNIGAEQLQVWRQAASNAGVSANDFNGSLASLTQKIGEANAGNRAAQQSFVDLGIGFATTAGQARATDAVMLDLATRIASIEDPAERLRVGTQLLGNEFKTLYPLLLDGAAGLDQARAEMERFGGVLSQEELQTLNKLNTDIEKLKDQLSRSVAQVVAQNAGAISNFADELAKFADQAIKAANAQYQFAKAMKAADDLSERGVSAEEITRRTGVRSRRPRGLGEWLYHMGQDVREYQAYGNFDDRSYLTDYGRQQIAWWLRPADQREVEDVAAPRVTGGGARRAAGGGRARTARETPEERLAKQAAREAIRNEEQFRDALARTLRAQEDSAELQRIRTEQGEVAAARAEAELGFLRQVPLAVNETVEALAKALGIDGEITKERRAQLQLYLDQVKAIKDGAGDAAEARAQAEIDRETDRQNERNAEIAKQAAARWEAAHEQAIFNVADIFETAMRGGTDDLWRNFRDEGLRMIAEVAAQWSLSMIAGQPFNFNSAVGQAFGRSPLSSIFFGAGGRGGFDATLFGGAANDNGLFRGPTMTGFGGGIFGLGGRFMGANGRGGNLLPSGAGPGMIPNGLSGGAGFLQSPTFALGLGTLTTSLVGGGQASQLGGLVGSIGGQALGSSIAALGSFGGPIGAIAGALLGSVLPKVLSSPKRASVTVGGAGGTLGITGRQGNSAAREATATQGAGSLIDAIFQIADQLGGGVDASRGSVSFGMRKNSFRVDPTGRGITKIGNGAIDFGSDQEAAIRFAVQDLIRDGVITGISQASQNLLQRGGDLESQIEKALLIEQIPKLLRQRFDPLGAALDELFDKFKRVNDALVEGSASAEQFAQARQLWELEKADAIASVGAASQSLKDFLAALNAGSSSPLSLREQRAEAERQLEPFLAQISAAERARAEVDRLRAGGASAAEIEAAEAAARTAAAAINQDGFTQASQLLLGISRQSNASSGAYFSDFDRIRALTGSAIGFVDQASARDADTRDPFARETAANTRDSAIILSELSAESRAQGETLRQIAAALSGGSGGGFIRESRAFAP